MAMRVGLATPRLQRSPLVPLAILMNSNTVLDVTRLSGPNFNKPTVIMDPRIWEFSTTYSF